MSEITVDFANEYIKKATANQCFDVVLKDVEIISIKDGNLVARMVVSKQCCNLYGTLHGGFIATLIDVLTSIGMTSHPSKPNTGVSVDLNVSYLRKAGVNEAIVIYANTIKVGKTIGFAEAIIKSEKTGDVVAKGSHTRFVGSSEKYKIMNPVEMTC